MSETKTGTDTKSGTKAAVRAGRRTVPISRPEKVLFPDDGITKSDLVDHYRAVSRLILPQVRGRPLMMERHPDGIGGSPLMQKNAPDYFPDWVRRAVVPKEDGEVTHVVCDDVATLVYLADQACLTPHRWLSRADRPHHPDRLVLDLDPPPDADFEKVRWAARRVCGLLGELGLPGLLMTTGSRGLHVVVPLDRRADFDSVRNFARDAADLLAARHPDRLTTEPRKAERGGRLYLDTQRNGYAQTAVAPYAVRARRGAPVAAPIAAEELDDPELTADRWTLRTFGDRLERDPWAKTRTRGRSLLVPRRRLAELSRETLPDGVSRPNTTDLSAS
ncbi:non-homologous end-joining DNA ligase [Streptomyces sp. ME19-01-6]|uniref:non-homologous end-joining DNA ligase n=1 Tax=Streptomyces sp. ME19-01-6 TaxID=3028686 RepID=UPI0029A5633D|nr:non-homologous end-joining DNA ligase [Streptomyces sp. ME19-01-6]MDX3226865.1 non-homologous end-joining DNA ligase [Streptomyces sp. ME19-01-6]